VKHFAKSRADYPQTMTTAAASAAPRPRAT
jgi:hypothetical protein